MSLSICKTYLEQKILLCEKLLTITETTWQNVNNNEFSSIEEHFAHRERLMTQIQELDNVYAPKYSPFIKDAVGLHGYTNRLKTIFTTVLELDEKIKAKILTSQDSLQQEFGQFKNQQKVQNAYEGKETTQGFYLYKQR